MGKREIPTPLVAALIAIIVALTSFYLYKGATGGTVGDGHEGRIQASPPMPDAAKQQMMQQAQQAQQTR